MKSKVVPAKEHRKQQVTNIMRIKYIEGMRGLAALMVLFSHLIAAFYPVLYPYPTVFPISLDELAAQPLLVKAFVFSPLNIFYNGIFAVMIFLFISGYVVSYNCFHNKDKNYITASFFKRYFRLTIPILFSCVISYFLLEVGAFFNVKASGASNSPWLIQFYACDANFFNMIKFVLYDEYIRTYSIRELLCYGTILWMTYALLLGSFLVYAFYALFAQASSRLRIFIYIALIIIFGKSLFLAVILGMILCDMDAHNVFQKVNKIILLIILLPGIYLASLIRLDFPFYTILDIDFMKNYFGGWFPLACFYYIVGAFLLFFTLSRFSFSRKVFSSKAAVYIGKISFSIYILHLIVICSLSSYIFLWLKNDINASNELSFIVTSAMTIVVTILLSHIFHHYIELKSVNWSQSLYNLVSRKVSGTE
jgi:peptidoglycan/LPS O-acetylase OafA/YrhL